MFPRILDSTLKGHTQNVLEFAQITETFLKTFDATDWQSFRGIKQRIHFKKCGWIS